MKGILKIIPGLLTMVLLLISCEKSEMEEIDFLLNENADWASMEAVSYSHLIIPTLGYRYQKPEKHKIFAGLGYSPIISYDGISVQNHLIQFKNHFYMSVGLNL